VIAVNTAIYSPSGDVITAVNGDAVRDSRDLARKIGGLASDTKVTLGIFRKGEHQSVALTLQEMPNDRVSR
jgi:serine protease Do